MPAWSYGTWSEININVAHVFLKVIHIKQKFKSTTNAALQDLHLIVEHTSCNLFYHFWWKISLYPDPAKGNLNLNGIFSFLSVNDEN